MAIRKLNPQAVELNETIKSCSPVVYELLSKKGKAIFFPKKGILAQGADAKGKEIDATLGTALEDDCKPMILSSVKKYLKDIESGEAFPYAPSFGVAELREVWKEMLVTKNPSLKGKSFSKPVVTSALTHGLSIAGYMFIDGDDVLVHPDLFWGNYKLVFNHGYGADVHTFRFFDGGHFDCESFKNAIMEDGNGKKIILLNFPNNPAGYTPTIEAVQEITGILREAADAGNKMVVVLDDAYFGLVFKEGIFKESLFADLADLHENLLAIKIDGVTKEDYAWGLRVGFITYGIKNGTPELYNALEAKTAGAVRGNISNTCHLSQTLVLKSFLSPEYDTEKEMKYKLLKQRFDIVNEILNTHPEYKKYFAALPFNSGYFMCVELKDLDADKVRKQLLEKYSTGLIAIDSMLRIAFSATPSGKLGQLFDNLYNACKDISGDAAGEE